MTIPGSEWRHSNVYPELAPVRDDIITLVKTWKSVELSLLVLSDGCLCIVSGRCANLGYGRDWIDEFGEPLEGVLAWQPKERGLGG